MNLDQVSPAEHRQPDNPGRSVRASPIRQLNDALRRHGCGGHLVVTSGLMNLPATTRAGIVRAVRLFDGFGPHNDPYGEHSE